MSCSDGRVMQWLSDDISLKSCTCGCLCVCAAFTCVSHGVHLLQYVCQSQRTISIVSPHLPSHIRCSCCLWQANRSVSLRLLWLSFLSFCGSIVMTDVWSHTAHWESCEDLNPGLRAYLASSLLTEPPSQRQATFAEISWLSGQSCLCFYSIGDWTQGFVHRRCVP